MPTSPEWKRNRYQRLRDAGVCAQCGGERDSVRILCGRCTAGVNKASAKWKAKNPNADKDKQLRRKYGMSRTDWLSLLASQGGTCAICCTSKPVRSWTVDHCHASGRVRAILCHPCNVGLGQFKDDPATLERAAEYLKRHRLIAV